MAQLRVRRPRTGLVAALATALTLTGLGVVQAAPASAAPSLSVVPSQPMLNEVVNLRGVIGPATRTVGLQKLVGGRWSAVTSKRTSSGGAYAFPVTATGTTTSYRVVAPAAKVNRKRYAAVTSATRPVRGVAGTATPLTVLPHPMGNSSGATLPTVTRFSPARPGKVVQLLRQGPGGSTVVARGVQGSDGTATVAVPAPAPGEAATYQAMSLNGGKVANTFTQPTPASATTSAQSFGDEFAGTALDRSRWNTRVQPYHGNRKCARPADSRVAVAGGVLRLSVRKTTATSTVVDGRVVKCPYGVWENGMIGTAEGNANPFSQAYGVFAARVALQNAKGMHGSFWLQGQGSSAAEIDVIEHFGTGHPSALTSKIHYTGGGTLQSATTGNLVGTLKGGRATSWNVYSVEWSPAGYVFRINGVESWRTDRPHVSSAQQEMILSLLTSDWALPGLKEPSSTMQVDWVRAWTS